MAAHLPICCCMSVYSVVNVMPLPCALEQLTPILWAYYLDPDRRSDRKHYQNQSQAFYLLGNAPRRLYGHNDWVRTVAEGDSAIGADVGSVNAKADIGRSWAYC